MIKNKFLLISFIMVLIIGCSANVLAVEKLELVAAHNQTSKESPYQVGMLKFKEACEDLSDGAITVQVHAGTLGTSESELVEKLKLGAADVVIVSPGFMSKTGIKQIQLFAFPYLFNDYNHWGKVVDGVVGSKIANIVNEKSHNDFKVLGYWSAGVRHYYGKKPLHNMADLEGMKIRTQTSGVVADFWSSIGAVPTSVAWGELYQALQQGVVDGAENAYPFFVQESHHKTRNGKFTTETGHDYTTRFMLINGSKFDSLSAEQQEIIEKAAKISIDAEREEVRNQETQYKQVLLDEGGKVNEIDRQPFIEAAMPIQDKAAAQYGVEDLLQMIRDLR
ncbi:TRAP transporter substrate-binding protein [Halanaerobium salsuginis]|jgi:tripartite ATP-independent transporter DctP family solute receptor|uniref:Tripartite ATP-independent transporter solute receptor, DctP family n=1 Tax=Halanaerobium salsuginis TaxID=29563 RepID=A0A1I4FQR4_9FIRM|nr:TRAP transporter substrate-binding protein [Halanaerobium salsuginis]SFL20184.1 tripartite ATP-independent transporter solute receptor, DctP family [Halanaerobium salsuginis]